MGEKGSGGSTESGSGVNEMEEGVGVASHGDDIDLHAFPASSHGADLC
jgi:hypothetical protein